MNDEWINDEWWYDDVNEWSMEWWWWINKWNDEWYINNEYGSMINK